MKPKEPEAAFEDVTVFRAYSVEVNAKIRKALAAVVDAKNQYEFIAAQKLCRAVLLEAGPSE